MKTSILSKTRLSFISFTALLLNPSAFAANGAPERVSSLCQAEDIQDVKCEDSRECVFKTQNAIKTFFEKYEAPTAREIAELKYPRKCSSRGAKHNAVNLTYTVSPNGEAQHIQVLNSSSDCFSKTAIAHIEKMKFNATEQGYLCVPASVSFIVNPSKAYEGDFYRGPQEEPANLRSAYNEIRTDNLRRGR